MRRMLSLFVLTLVVVSVLGRGPLPAGIVRAQDATPAVDFEPLAAGVATGLTFGAGDFSLFRLRLAPGASFAFGADVAGAALGYVEAGSATARVDGPMTVLRAVAAGTPSPLATEQVAAGTAFRMDVGDSAVFPAHVAGELRNDGTTPVVFLVAEIGPQRSGAAGAPSA